MEYRDIFEKIVEEIARARGKHPPFHSHHEAYAVIKEEFEEWWDSVKMDDPDPKELLSVAAMAVLALMELPYDLSVLEVHAATTVLPEVPIQDDRTGSGPRISDV
jgi:hypothetical protein